MTIFHIAPLLLEVGSIVLPGNYGRIIRQIGTSHPCWEREQVLENVRLRAFSAKPSRMAATFACPALQIAELYRMALKKTAEIIYEVEYIDKTAPTHVGDFNVAPPLAGRSESMEQMAERYWRNNLKTNINIAPDVPCTEIVSSSAIRILRRC